MTSRIWFITGSDTQVGKTFLTVLLANHLERQGDDFRAVKPFCSGDRADADLIQLAQKGRLGLDAINPWHFTNPLTPTLAARKEGRRVTLRQTLRFLQSASNATPNLLIEGAGGLLSPLGVGFSARELIVALDAIPLIVCTNRIGAINQSRLVLAALPRKSARRGHLVLMDPATPDDSTASNAGMLADHHPSDRIHRVPWNPRARTQKPTATIRRVLERLLA